jgi:hypothetical protein
MCTRYIEIFVLSPMRSFSAMGSACLGLRARVDPQRAEEDAIAATPIMEDQDIECRYELVAVTQTNDEIDRKILEFAAESITRHLKSGHTDIRVVHKMSTQDADTPFYTVNFAVLSKSLIKYAVDYAPENIATHCIEVMKKQWATVLRKERATVANIEISIASFEETRKLDNWELPESMVVYDAQAIADAGLRVLRTKFYIICGE